MAKFKKSAKNKSTSAKPDVQAKAERLSKSLSESAQQIWLAGVGAFGRAQAEGTKLFEGLVKEGLNLEQSARKFAGGRAEVVRDAVEKHAGQARERASDTWDRLEGVFEDRVQRALTRLGVPGRDDLADLSGRVEDLTAELRRQNAGSGRKPATTSPPAQRRSATYVPAKKAAEAPPPPPAATKPARKATKTAKTTKRSDKPRRPIASTAVPVSPKD